MPDAVVLELVKGLPTALVASVAVYVAWRQYETARAKVKLDLFDRRYAVFEETWKHLSAISTNSISLHDSLRMPFDNLRTSAGFLFDDEIADYLEKIRSSRVELGMIERRTKTNGNVLLPEDIDRHTALQTWFLDQAADGVKKKFKPWLGLEELK